MAEHLSSPDGDKPLASIIIPCFNGERTIAKSLESLTDFLETRRSSFAPWEVLVLDDGSSDASAEIVRTQFPHVRLITMERNHGKGAAVRQGMLQARGAYRFFVDADLPFDLDALERMHHYLQVKEFDITIGSRTAAPSAHLIRRTALRRFASAIFTSIVSRVVVTGVRDTQCGMKGFTEEAARYLFSQSRVNGFAFDVEILYLAYKNDMEIKRVPVKLVREDDSTVSVFGHGARMLFDVVALPFRFHLGAYEPMRRGGTAEDQE